MKQRLRCRKKLEAEWNVYIDECMKSADMVLDLSPGTGVLRTA